MIGVGYFTAPRHRPDRRRLPLAVSQTAVQPGPSHARRARYSERVDRIPPAMSDSPSSCSAPRSPIHARPFAPALTTTTHDERPHHRSLAREFECRGKRNAMNRNRQQHAPAADAPVNDCWRASLNARINVDDFHQLGVVRRAAPLIPVPDVLVFAVEQTLQRRALRCSTGTRNAPGRTAATADRVPAGRDGCASNSGSFGFGLPA